VPCLGFLESGLAGAGAPAIPVGIATPLLPACPELADQRQRRGRSSEALAAPAQLAQVSTAKSPAQRGGGPQAVGRAGSLYLLGQPCSLGRTQPTRRAEG